MLEFVAAWHHEHRHGQGAEDPVGRAAQEDGAALGQPARPDDQDLAVFPVEAVHGLLGVDDDLDDDLRLGRELDARRADGRRCRDGLLRVLSGGRGGS